MQKKTKALIDKNIAIDGEKKKDYKEKVIYFQF